MLRLQSVAEGIARAGSIAGGALLLIASILVCIDITLRYTLSITLGGADELSGYALAIGSAWGFSSALLSRSHIRIDTVYVRVRPRVRALLDLLSLAVLAFFFGLVSWYAWGVVKQSWDSNSHSLSEIEAPLVVPQALWFAGLVFFVALTLFLLLRGLIALFTGDLSTLFRLIGSKSAVDEAQEEVVNVERAFEQERKE
ncbi:TRAP transporter small permease subunit [Reyranella sp.]|uniref:TRAP transporter small permease subunit n=1 Tax=Reyranella sp. TaxID=1929291 RepID=UPI00378403F7